MEKVQVLEKIEILENEILEKQEQKEVLISDIGKAETEIKIKQAKIIDIDEDLLLVKSEIVKYKNYIEILDR